MATIWVWRMYGRESGTGMLPDITG